LSEPGICPISGRFEAEPPCFGRGPERGGYNSRFARASRSEVPNAIGVEQAKWGPLF
jgi:hypothetical protein